MAADGGSNLHHEKAPATHAPEVRIPKVATPEVLL